MASTAESRYLRGRIAGLSRDRKPNDPELLQARRDLAALRLREHVESVLADAPPLTEEQRTRIAGLITGGAA